MPSKWYRVIAFLVGAFGMAMLSVVAAFNVYANAFKSKFNYTQQEVELLASVGVIGQFLGIPAGMLFHSYGPRATSLVGLILSAVGFLLIYMAIRLNHIFSSYSFVVSIFFFIANHSLSYSYLGFLLTNMELFSDAHRGKIVVALNTLYQAPFWPFIYNYAFLGEDVKYQSQDNIGGFFLTLGIVFIVVNLLGLVILRKNTAGNETKQMDYGETELSPMTTNGNTSSETKGNEKDREKMVSKDEQTEIKPATNSQPFLTRLRKTFSRSRKKKSSSYIDDTHECEVAEVPEGQPLKTDVIISPQSNPSAMSLIAMFTKPAFQCAMWVVVFAFAVNITLLANLSAILYSVALSDWFSLFIIACPLIGLLMSFTICTLSSLFAHRIRSSVISLGLTSLQLASQILLIFFMDSMPVLFICTCVEIGTALSSFSLIPTIVSRELGSDNFNRIWGYVLLLVSLVTLAGQNSFGAIYESKITDHGTHCTGTHCVVDCFLMMSTACGVSVLFNVGLVEVGW